MWWWNFTEKCDLDCGSHGRCQGGECICIEGWTGAKCNEKLCDIRCVEHGQCKNGTCLCIQGWNGRHCTLGTILDISIPRYTIFFQDYSLHSVYNPIKKVLTEKKIFFKAVYTRCGLLKIHIHSRP